MTTIINTNTNSLVSDARIKKWFSDNSINTTGKSVNIQRNTNGLLLQIIVDVPMNSTQTTKFKTDIFDFQKNANKGATGLKGDTGDDGTDGAQGIQGLKGDTGDDGTDGATGLKGDTGDDGTDGAQGIQGLKGDTGTDGAQGIQGIAGVTTQEIGRSAEITSNTNTIVVNLSPTKKNLFVKFLLIPTGLMLAQMIFNDDTLSTKAERIHDNHDAILQVVNDNEIQISDAGGESSPMAGTIEITNIQNQIKLGAIRKVGANGATSTTVPTFKNSSFKWVNTTVSINKITFTVTFGTGLYTQGSYVIVEGYD